MHLNGAGIHAEHEVKACAVASRLARLVRLVAQVDGSRDTRLPQLA